MTIPDRYAELDAALRWQKAAEAELAAGLAAAREAEARCTRARATIDRATTAVAGAVRALLEALPPGELDEPDPREGGGDAA